MAGPARAAVAGPLVRVTDPETWTCIAVEPGGGRHRRMDLDFRLYSSEADMRAAIRGRAIADPQWRRRWRNWTFFPIRIDNGEVMS